MCGLTLYNQGCMGWLMYSDTWKQGSITLTKRLA